MKIHISNDDIVPLVSKKFHPQDDVDENEQYHKNSKACNIDQ